MLTLITNVAPVLAGTPEIVLEKGCTPGFYKNHSHYVIEGDVVWPYGSLEEALRGKGGPGIEGATEILLRARAAAYLNAVNIVDPWWTWVLGVNGVLAKIDDALATGERSKIISAARELDDWNNTGECPVH